MDTVRVLRLIEYEGPRDLMEKQLAKSLHGTRIGMCSKEYPDGIRITAVTLDQFPQILEEGRSVPCPVEMTKLKESLDWTQNQLSKARAVIDDEGLQDINGQEV